MRKFPLERRFELSTDRIEALSDGIFAIAMTILIFDLKVPILHKETASATLPDALLALWPKILGYVISFVILGVYWVAHHLHFASIKRADRGLLWINILFLMCIGFVPFSTGLMGEYIHHPLPVILYGINLIVISLVLALHWWYATRHGRLVDATIDPHLVRSVIHVIFMGPVVYLAAIACAFINTMISILLYALVTLIYIIPGGAHLHLKEKGRA